jgi:DNA-binding response OmpR family regulator
MRILVVEDEALIAMEIAVILEEAGAEIIGPANSVEQGHQLIAQQASDPHAALLDVNVAGVSSDSIARLLLARKVPFAFMTGYTSAEVSELVPAAPVLQKPFTPAQLLAVLQSLLPA